MIISTSNEIRSLVERDLSIDLSPNPKICMSAEQALEKMRQRREIPTKHVNFKFDSSRVNEVCLAALKS